MDRPEPIFNHADLGTREPGDPELRGYDPGHPWYYLLGGRPLRPEEIEPNFEWELPHDVALERLKEPAKRTKRLLDLREDYEKNVQCAIERYKEVISPAHEVSAYDWKMGYGLETAIYLSHNHLLSYQAWLAAINRELAKYQPPLLKGILDREWVPSAILRAKEQLRLF